ncbi:70 kDa peptidyl-prolyl isomerase-like protein, partial [Tanacetum coccineum]
LLPFLYSGDVVDNIAALIDCSKVPRLGTGLEKCLLKDECTCVDNEERGSSYSVTMTYEIERVFVVKDKESWDLDAKEKIEAAGMKKEEGNVLFKADSNFKGLWFLNDAACKLKLKDYKEAVKLCTKSMDYDVKEWRPLNVAKSIG